MLLIIIIMSAAAHLGSRQRCGEGSASHSASEASYTQCKSNQTTDDDNDDDSNSDDLSEDFSSDHSSSDASTGNLVVKNEIQVRLQVGCMIQAHDAISDNLDAMSEEVMRHHQNTITHFLHVLFACYSTPYREPCIGAALHLQAVVLEDRGFADVEVEGCKSSASKLMVGIPIKAFTLVWNETMRRANARGQMWHENTRPKEAKWEPHDDELDCNLAHLDREEGHCWFVPTAPAEGDHLLKMMRERARKLRFLGLLDSDGKRCDALATVYIIAHLDRTHEKRHCVLVYVSHLLMRGPFARPLGVNPIWPIANSRAIEDVLAGTKLTELGSTSMARKSKAEDQDSEDGHVKRKKRKVSQRVSGRSTSTADQPPKVK